MLSNLAILGNLNTTFCLSQRNADCHILVIPHLSINFHQNDLAIKDSLFKIMQYERYKQVSVKVFFSGAANFFYEEMKTNKSRGPWVALITFTAVQIGRG